MPVLAIGGIPLTLADGYVIGELGSVLSAPVNTVAPTISGNAPEGSTLTVSNGTWTGNPTPTYTYQWRRAGTPISGATSSTYVTVSADVGNAITCQVTATNSQGAASAVSSNSITVTALVVGNITYTSLGQLNWTTTTFANVSMNVGAARSGRTMLVQITGNWSGTVPSVTRVRHLTHSSEPDGVLLTEGSSETDYAFSVAIAVPDYATGIMSIRVDTSQVMSYGRGTVYVIDGAELPAAGSGSTVGDNDFPFAPVVPLTIPQNGAVFSVAAMNDGTTAIQSVGATTLATAIYSNNVNRSVHVGAATDFAAQGANWSQDSTLCFVSSVAVFTPLTS